MSQLTYPVTLGMRFDTNPDPNPETVELHPEKYIDLGAMEDKLPFWVKHTLKSFGWEFFATSVTGGHTSLCSEFLYHARRTNEDAVLIRGVEICFSTAQIRWIYDLPYEETCYFIHYTQLRGNVEFENWVLFNLSRPDTHPEIDNFPLSALNANAKFWYYFIKSRILKPSSNTHVTWDVMIMIFCLQEGSPFDVAPLIYQSLKQQISEEHFYFPCLISLLSEVAGIKPAFHGNIEFRGIRLGPSTLRFIQNYIKDRAREEGSQRRGSKSVKWGRITMTLRFGENSSEDESS